MKEDSDIRVKNDLGNLDYTDSIKLLSGLQPKKFTYKNDDAENVLRLITQSGDNEVN